MFTEEKAKGEVKELDEASLVLLRAAALIEQRGLPSCATEGGRRCVILTIAGIHSPVGARTEAIDRVAASIKDVVSHWSDRAGAEGRAHEVVAHLRAVAFSS